MVRIRGFRSIDDSVSASTEWKSNGCILNIVSGGNS